MKLVAHPDTTIAIVRTVAAAVAKEGASWRFRFEVEGARDLVVPPPAQAHRTDELWTSTCFEAFVAIDGRAYVELNFSPSGQWAAYRFDGHRDGMRDEPAEVEISVERGGDTVVVEAKVDCNALVAGAALGLSAVIEGLGARSYWALAHPVGAPDFHLASCFLARLPE